MLETLDLWRREWLKESPEKGHFPSGLVQGSFVASNSKGKWSFWKAATKAVLHLVRTASLFLGHMFFTSASKILRVAI